MLKEKFKDFASTTIVNDIDSSTTSIIVTDSGVFPEIDTTISEYFMSVIYSDENNDFEVVKVIDRVNNNLTIIRGQNGTTARAFSADSKIVNRITSEFLNKLSSTVRTITQSAAPPSGGEDGDIWLQYE